MKALFLLSLFLFGFGAEIKGCDTLTIHLYIDSVLAVVNVYQKENAHDSSIQLIKKALQFVEEKKCMDDYRTFDLYQRLGHAYYLSTNYPEAEIQFNKVISGRKIHFGEDHINTANGFNMLGNLYVDMGQYAKAESLYNAVKAIYLNKLPEGHLWQGWIYHNIGRLKIFQGKIQESLVDLNQALEIKIENLGDADIDVANTMVYLAYVYGQLGDLKTSEYHASKSAAIWINHYGEGSLYHGYAANNLVEINLRLGNYQKALQLAKTSVELKIKHLGPTHPSVATTYNVMGNVYLDQDMFDPAIDCYHKAMSIFNYNKDTLNVEYAFVNHNIGVCFMGKNNFLLAKTSLEKALRIKAGLNGIDNMDYFSTAIQLSRLYVKEKNYTEYYDELLRAKAYMNANRLEVNENYLLILWLMETIAENRNDSIQTYKLLEEQVAIRQQQLQNLSLLATEGEILSLIDKTEELLLKYYGFCIRYKPDDGWAGQMLDKSIFYKSYLLNDYLSLRNFVAMDSASRNEYSHYAGINQEIYQSHFDEYDTSGKRDSLFLLKTEIERRMVKRMDKGAKLPEVIGWKHLQSKMEDGEAIIDFITYSPYGSSFTSGEAYAAVILTAGNPQPVVVELPELYLLDSLLNQKNNVDADFIFELYSNDPFVKSDHKNQTFNLYDLIFKPLVQHLKGIHTLYYMPAGLLHAINLNAISIQRDSLIEDQYQCVLINSAHAFLHKKEEGQFAYSNAFIAGGINYDGHSSVGDQQNSKPELSVSVEHQQEELKIYENRGGSWGALIYSAKEADQINELFNQRGITTTLLKGEDATEEAFKLLGLMDGKSPDLMHISTHGYYFSVHEYEDAVRKGIREDEGSMFRSIEHPFIRTGLILAGGNKAWNTENKFGWMGEDGILTSYEISQLNLRHTDLVVLSSCESGLGDVHGDEGVFGLPRAFRIAGVKNLIFSLWQVPDFHTKELMIEFYHNLIIKGLSLRSSFAQAQQAMRQKGYEPYYWAGFVLME